ncbi:MAG TPA: diguanylate cyclase [Pyrinomonadaceae bacterium]|nr:diguanylate cyclase [Pyrinomonadaceae bacterium]
MSKFLTSIRQKEKARAEQARVLVVTDQPDVSFRETLKATGLDVVGVSSGTAALVSLHRERPQLVIADAQIKGLSIVDLVKACQATEEIFPLIMVGTANANNERRKEALIVGAFDYFQIPEEIELLAMRAKQLIGIRHSIDRLRSEADLDHLTGLANRRRFRSALAREVERFRRYGTPCALLLLDIDYMKSINDKHGHPFGDIVIRHIAQKLTQVSRDTDTAARLGGEEFALLLAGIDAEKAESAAQRLLTILSAEVIEGKRRVTVSIGLAACPAHANSERTLYAASDAALYMAKNAGRNRVAVAPQLQQNLPGV